MGKAEANYSYPTSYGKITGFIREIYESRNAKKANPPGRSKATSGKSSVRILDIVSLLSRLLLILFRRPASLRGLKLLSAMLPTTRPMPQVSPRVTRSWLTPSTTPPPIIVYRLFLFRRRLSPNQAARGYLISRRTKVLLAPLAFHPRRVFLLSFRTVY